MANRAAPIGVFDSGIGGLSVLKALRAQLPHESFVYFADSANQPYGEKGDAFVAARSQTIVRELVKEHQIKALVVACNTATAAAVRELRLIYPALPLVGIEPAIKPAARLSQTRHIGVIATRGTVQSAKLARLLERHGGDATFICRACDGLAEAIEQRSGRDNSAQIQALLEQHLAAMGTFGDAPGQMDTLVLGCTHYPLVQDLIQHAVGPQVRLLETGVPVARYTAQLLAEHGLLRDASSPPTLQLLTSAEPAHIAQAAAFWGV